MKKKRKRIYYPPPPEKHRLHHLYEPIAPEFVPEGIAWKSGMGPVGKTFVTHFSSFGKVYKRSRNTVTNEISYFKLKHTDETAALPASVIDFDDEPKVDKTRYYLGRRCWFISNTGHWHLCIVVARSGKPRPTVTIRPEGPYDADRVEPWPFPGDLEIPTHGTVTPNKPNGRHALFLRLRPLKARPA